MIESKIIETTTINNKSFSVFIFCFMFGGVAVSFSIAWWLQVFAVMWVGLFIFFLSPLIFQKRFRKGFINTAVLRFFTDYFEVELIDTKTGIAKKSIAYKFSEMESFNAIDSSKDDSSFLKIVLRNGTSSHYTFLGQDEDNNKNNVTEVVAEFIHSYNNTHEEADKITFLPPLFASKNGKLYIIALTILLIVVVCIEFINNSKAIPLTIGSGLFLYFIILIQWKKDIDQYKKMK